jgi:hypothetical protein
MDAADGRFFMSNWQFADNRPAAHNLGARRASRLLAST